MQEGHFARVKSAGRGLPRFLAINLAAAACLLSAYAWAGPMAVFPVQGAEHNANSFVTKNHLVMLKGNGGQFKNGNSYVQFAESVQNKDILVYLPSTLTPDALIEAAIAVRNAKTNGAQSVTVYSPTGSIAGISVAGSGGDVIGVSVHELLSVAGATIFASPAGTVAPAVVSKRVEEYAASNPILYSANYPDLAQKISKVTGIQLEPNLNAAAAKGNRVYVISASVNPVNENLLRGMAVIRKIRENGGRAEAIFPYLPYARSDKVDQPGVTVAGRLVADLIESSGAGSISFVRAHAAQSQGFFGIPSYNLSGIETITAALKDEGVEEVISPDAGFQKDATLYAQKLGVPVAVVNKQRHGDEITLNGVSGDPVKGKTVAIIDDETASGGTMADVSAMMKKLGATKVIAAVTHLAGNGKGALESRDIAKLIVTDTMPVAPDPRITVLSIADEIGAHISLMQQNIGNNACGSLAERLHLLASP